jgi:hypothetical protein
MKLRFAFMRSLSLTYRTPLTPVGIRMLFLFVWMQVFTYPLIRLETLGCQVRRITL